MSELGKASNAEFLQELKKRVNKKKISKEEIFKTLETSSEPKLITEYKSWLF